ncbi:MAG TPA: ABC transporter permease [Acidimicrobiales bacterium]|nr:ABC transporter permease [Acidimicrobiales bacterium]
MAELQVAGMVCLRELIRFSRNRIRVATSLAQPLLFLFVLGTGLSQPSTAASSTVDFRTFIFPGVLAMTVLFPAFFSAMTLVWDRQEGFLREMLVAPVRRSSVIVGKCLGGSAVALAQGTVMLALAPLVHVPYSPGLLLVLAELALTAFLACALGLFVASRLDDIESFQALIQLLILPIFFLSGALFPLTKLPAWLGSLTRINPLTYAVDAMRRTILDAIGASPATIRSLSPGVTWGSVRLSAPVELAIVALLGVALLMAAIRQFSRVD